MISGSALSKVVKGFRSRYSFRDGHGRETSGSGSDGEEADEERQYIGPDLATNDDSEPLRTVSECPSGATDPFATSGRALQSFKNRLSFARKRSEQSFSHQIAEVLADYKGATARNELLVGSGRRGGTPATVRRQIYCLLDEPDSSIWASIIAWTIFLLILLSTTTYCVETLPGIASDCEALKILYILDAVTVSIFTVEYFLRWYVSPNRLTFPVQYKNMIDVVAIIPFYLSPTPSRCMPDGIPISTGGASNVDLRFLRLLRVFRTFKLSGYGPQLELVSTAVRESQEMLMMFLINLMIVIIIFSSMIYLCENKEDGTKFTSIPASCWWAIVTVLTVGYGDMAPETLPGKLVASLLMIIALVVIALPVSIIGTNFTLEWERNKGEQKAVSRAAELPGKLKQIYPHMELWMDELGRHTIDLRRETKLLKRLTQEMNAAPPESQMAHLESITKAADAVTKLTSDDIIQSVTVCSKVIKQLEKFQLQLMDLNDKGKSELEVSLKTVQDSFAGALMRMGAVEDAMDQSVESYNLQQMQKDLRSYQGVAIIEVVGCKGIGGSLSKFKDIPDPYVAMTSGKEIAKTSVVQNSSSPLFDEVLLLLVEDSYLPISIDVWDKEYFTKDEFMGSHKLRLAAGQSSWSEASKFRLTKGGKPAGVVMLRYKYHSFMDLTEEKLKDPGLWPKLLSITTSCDISEAFSPVLPSDSVVTDECGPPVLTRLGTAELSVSRLGSITEAPPRPRMPASAMYYLPNTPTPIATHPVARTPPPSKPLAAGKRRVSFPMATTDVLEFDADGEDSEGGGPRSPVYPRP